MNLPSTFEFKIHPRAESKIQVHHVKEPLIGSSEDIINAIHDGYSRGYRYQYSTSNVTVLSYDVHLSEPMSYVDTETFEVKQVWGMVGTVTMLVSYMP
jgi:hypothetical protein